jgi:demethylmenaquinone methyltransferase/2-methoxy-6-polyprenyl-1,4-benzoquinol methylase
LAYRYDLYMAPFWREPFDQMVSERVALPAQGTILEVNCGTGGLAMEVAERLGQKGEVVATDPQAERLKIARAKAEIKKLSNVSFLEKDPIHLGLDEGTFSLVIGDATLMSNEDVEAVLTEMVQMAEPGATVALKLLTRSSFGEFFSILWEALLEGGLLEYSDRVEALINNFITTNEAEDMMQRLGLRHVRHFTERKEFDFDSAGELLESPLIEDFFLEPWLAFLPDEAAHRQIVGQVVEIIERERRESYFEISVKATLLVATKAR